MHKHKNTKGFTLIELSLIIVIASIIMGGVLLGQNLIKEAETNGVAAEIQKIMAGYNQYKEKFNAIPGDHATAYNYFSAGCKSAGGGVAGECNGNGNGRIVETLTGSTSYGECYMMFRHLFLAGFYYKNLNGLYSATPVLDTNTPSLPMAGGTFFPYAWYKSSYFVNGGTGSTTGSTANILSLGAVTSSVIPDGVFLTPSQANQIDEKIDDGAPGTGAIIAGNQASGCASSATMQTAAYSTTTTTIVCKLGAILEDNI